MKKYKGWELIKLIGEGKIEDETIFETDIVDMGEVKIIGRDIYSLEIDGYVTDYFSLGEIGNTIFKEKLKKFDIQSIEPLNSKNSETLNEEIISDKVNELITAIKYLDEEISDKLK